MVIYFTIFISNDIIMTFFSFNLLDKLNVIISEVHYKSIFKRIHSIFLNMIFTKIYYNMDSLNFDNVNVEYEFIF